MKKVKDLKKWIELYNEVKAAADELQLAYEYVKEGIVSEEEVDAAYAKALELIENLEFRNPSQTIRTATKPESRRRRSTSKGIMPMAI